jgi:hypothetical protein
VGEGGGGEGEKIEEKDGPRGRGSYQGGVAAAASPLFLLFNPARALVLVSRLLEPVLNTNVVTQRGSRRSAR